ncbi:MAG TPA: response regulator [Candidatus Binataceae bacterium]|nr:response regulator [Candidatus Binataceae bacterium]
MGGKIADFASGWSRSDLFEKFSQSIKDSAILTLDQSGKITGWSEGAERMTGYRREEMDGRSFSLLYLPQELMRDRPGEAMRVASELGSFSEEGIRVRRDGSIVWVAMTLLKERSRWRPGIRFTCVMSDITETIRLRSEILRMREAVSTTGLARQGRLQSSALAHDLNNILNAMGLRLEAMRAAAPAQIEDIDRLRRLLADASDVTRHVQNGMGAESPVTGPIDPSESIGAAVARVRGQLRQRYPERDRVFHIDLEIGAFVPVAIVAEDLGDALERLLLSICDTMPSGGAVMIDASADSGHLTIAIDPHPLVAPTRSIDSSIFEAGEISRSLAQSGLIARLGASLRVEDRDGTDPVIILSVPIGEVAHNILARPPGTDHHERDGNSNGNAGDQPLRVLIIDDDRDNLDALGEALEGKGYVVATAENGYDGLRHLRGATPFDFVISDIGMPGMNGWEIAEQAAEIAPNTRVLLVTGWTSEIGRLDPRRKLVVDVLAKPIDLEVVHALIARGAK